MGTVELQFMQQPGGQSDYFDATLATGIIVITQIPGVSDIDFSNLVLSKAFGNKGKVIKGNL